MIEQITHTINKVEQLIQEQLPESKYQFELYDLVTNTRHFRGADEPFHWGSVYKLFVVAEIIKMAEEGLLKLDYELILHRDIYKNGNGISKYLIHLNRLSYLDACKMVMAASDNLCADELLHTVGFERLNELFEKANCHSSKLVVNLDTMVKELFEQIPNSAGTGYYHSADYFLQFDNSLKTLLENNYTTAKDINQCFHLVLSNYFKPDEQQIFKDLVLTPNIHSRIAAYTFSSKFLLRGKTGALGFGIVNSETVAIINKKTLDIKGYFTVSTKGNKRRNFQSNDSIGLIGLEIANLYEQLIEVKN